MFSHDRVLLTDKKMVLKHHPDKKGDLSGAEAKAADEYFDRIQRGKRSNGYLCSHSFVKDPAVVLLSSTVV